MTGRSFILMTATVMPKAGTISKVKEMDVSCHVGS